MNILDISNIRVSWCRWFESIFLSSRSTTFSQPCHRREGWGNCWHKQRPTWIEKLNSLCILYFPRPSQNKEPSSFYFYSDSQISITCSGLRPVHMVSDVLTLNSKLSNEHLQQLLEPKVRTLSTWFVDPPPSKESILLLRS